jgi:cytidylate kinase
MGTIIFPDARLKFFVEANLDVRAQRRFAQFQGTPQERSLESIRTALSDRDNRDATRSVAPTKPAEGAIVIDNSKSPLDETVERMYQVAIEGLPSLR